MQIENMITFGFEQTFSIPRWWESPGFCDTSDTMQKRELMLAFAKQLASDNNWKLTESKDIWGHYQLEVGANEVEFYVTMDPGSIELKTRPCLLNEIESYFRPLFEAASKVGLVPYRQWWYGVQGATEGGCHVNMGGELFEKDPEILLRYAAFMHNRPFLHFPFCGPDIGKGGNSERIDDKPDEEKIREVFKSKTIYQSLQQIYDAFGHTSLVKERSSFPSFRKFNIGLIEDRNQEALRSAQDGYLVSKLRLEILKLLLNSKCESLQRFDNVYECLNSFELWRDFQSFANSNSINPVPFQRFFDRQFPTIKYGDTPKLFELKEGRIPRKVLEINKNDQGEVISKKVDTSFKRFELCYHTDKERPYHFRVELSGEKLDFSPLQMDAPLNFGHPGVSYFSYFDTYTESPFEIELVDTRTKEVVERRSFDGKKMEFLKPL